MIEYVVVIKEDFERIDRQMTSCFAPLDAFEPPIVPLKDVMVVPGRNWSWSLSELMRLRAMFDRDERTGSISRDLSKIIESLQGEPDQVT